MYTFVYNLQEEAHRFAIKHSREGKSRSMRKSSLEGIDGIGPKKAKALLSAMPLGKIREASVEELKQVKGIGEADAKRIYEYFKKYKKSNRSEKPC